MKEIQYLSIPSWPGGRYWWLYSSSEISIFFFFVFLWFYDLFFINHVIFCIGFFFFLYHLKVFFRSFEFGAKLKHHHAVVLPPAYGYIRYHPKFPTGFSLLPGATVDSKPHDQPNPVAASVADVYVDMCDTFLVCNVAWWPWWRTITQHTCRASSKVVLYTTSVIGFNFFGSSSKLPHDAAKSCGIMRCEGPYVSICKKNK